VGMLLIVLTRQITGSDPAKNGVTTTIDGHE
jgi:hypothetical protein